MTMFCSDQIVNIKRYMLVSAIRLCYWMDKSQMYSIHHPVCRYWQWTMLIPDNNLLLQVGEGKLVIKTYIESCVCMYV